MKMHRQITTHKMKLKLLAKQLYSSCSNNLADSRFIQPTFTVNSVTISEHVSFVEAIDHSKKV